jgi:hypothetical protein
MTQSRLKLLLPIVQVLIAIGLISFGSHEMPTVQQDFPPYVPMATRLCYSINAPTVLLVGGLGGLSQKLHLTATNCMARDFPGGCRVVVVFHWLETRPASAKKHRHAGTTVCGLHRHWPRGSYGVCRT